MRRRIDPRREDGVAMAEFALVAPVFLLIVVATLVFGRMFFYWIELNHVANETARWAAVDRNPYRVTSAICPAGVYKSDTPTCQSLQQRARWTATDEFHDQTTACISFPDGAPTVGQRVKVDVSVPVSFIGLFDMGITLRGSSTMRIERFAGSGATAPVTYTATCSSKATP